MTRILATIALLFASNAFMTTAWIAQRGDPSMAELSFDERLALLVEAETLARDNKRLQKLLRDAKLRIPSACMEDVDLNPKRDIDRALFRELATGRWIAEHNNVLVTGMTGVGKSYLACALGQLACRLGFRVAYKRVPRLFEELGLAHADGTYVRLLTKLAKVDVLVLDDWGLAPLSDQQRRDVLEILEDRHGTRSTVVDRPVRCPSKTGTTTSPIPPSPTPSPTASSTTPTRSR